MQKQNPQTAYRKHAILIGTISENCDKITNGEYELMKQVLRITSDSFLWGMILFVANIFYCCGPLMPIADAGINVIFLMIAICMVVNFIRYRKSLFAFYWIPAILVIWYFLSIAVNKGNVVDIKLGVYYIVFLLFATNVWNDRKIEDLFTIFAKITCWIGMLINVPSILLYYTSYYKVFTSDVMSMALIFGRHPNGALYGILCNSNWLAVFCLLVLGMSAYLLLQGKNRVFYGIDFLVALIALVMSASRGGLVGAFAVAFVYAVLYIYNKKKRGERLTALLQTALAGCLMVAVLFGIVSLIKVANNALYNTVVGWSSETQIESVEEEPESAESAAAQEEAEEPESAESATAQEEEEEPESAESAAVQDAEEESENVGSEDEAKNDADNAEALTERDPEEKKSSTQIRLELWRSGLKVIRKHPVFGVGPHNLAENILANAETENITDELATNTHNIFIQVAVSIGLVGLLLFCICIAVPCVLGLRYIFSACSDNADSMITAIAIVAGFCVVNLVEADLLSKNFIATVFWMLVGFIWFAVREKKSQNNSNGVKSEEVA